MRSCETVRVAKQCRPVESVLTAGVLAAVDVAEYGTGGVIHGLMILPSACQDSRRLGRKEKQREKESPRLP